MTQVQLPEPYIPSKPAGDVYRCEAWEMYHGGDPDAPGELRWVNADDWEGMTIAYYDGYLNLEAWPAGWYCDDCLDALFMMGLGDKALRDHPIAQAFEAHLTNLIPLLYQKEGRECPEHLKDIWSGV